MKNYIRPQNITDWIIVCGLILFITSYTYRRILIFSNPDYDFLSVFTRLAIFENFEMLGLGMGMCAMIISGMQKVIIPTLKRKGLFQLIGGFLIGGFLIGSNILVSFLLPNLVQKLMISDERMLQIESRADTENMQPILGNQLKEIVAEQKYIKTGLITKYINSNGETIEYKPSSKTIEIRKNIQKIMLGSSRAKTWSMVWGATLIFMIIVGFTIARYRVTNKLNIKEP